MATLKQVLSRLEKRNAERTLLIEKLRTDHALQLANLTEKLKAERISLVEKLDAECSRLEAAAELIRDKEEPFFKMKVAKVRRAMADARRKGITIVTRTDQLFIQKRSAKGTRLVIRTTNECTPLQAVLLYNHVPPIMRTAYFDVESTICEALKVNTVWVRVFDAGLQGKSMPSVNNVFKKVYDFGKNIRKEINSPQRVHSTPAMSVTREAAEVLYL